MVIHLCRSSSYLLFIGSTLIYVNRILVNSYDFILTVREEEKVEYK